jgi:hypothetical protein
MQFRPQNQKPKSENFSRFHFPTKFCSQQDKSCASFSFTTELEQEILEISCSAREKNLSRVRSRYKFRAKNRHLFATLENIASTFLAFFTFLLFLWVDLFTRSIIRSTTWVESLTSARFDLLRHIQI